MNRKQANMRYDMEAQGITELTEFLFFTKKKIKYSKYLTGFCIDYARINYG